MVTKDGSRESSAWQQAILSYIAAHPDHPLKARALARELEITGSDYTRFREVVRSLLDSGKLVLGAGRALRLPAQSGMVTGVFRANPRGFGFVQRGAGPDLYVPRTRTQGAREGDQVVVRVLKARGRMPGPRAEVVKILQRAARRWVGVLERYHGDWVVRPQGREPLPPIRVSNPGADGAQAGDLVVIEPEGPEDAGGQPVGEITARLGDPRLAGPQIEGAVRQFALRDEFSVGVKRSVTRVVESYGPEAWQDRLDLRELLTVTIDPPDARDYDDAISVEPLADGRLRLGVHIADVSHFVRAGWAD